MVAYNFQAQFAVAVATGRKRQTIRAPRKDGRHAKPGDRLQLYTGMRTKSCRKLIQIDPICSVVLPVRILPEGIELDGDRGACRNWFAQLDGFEDWNDMRNWFSKQHDLPFNGVVIMWNPGRNVNPVRIVT